MTADITGQTFGRLTAVSHIEGSKWLCLCVCGKQTSSLRGNLLSGGSTSCGCSRRDASTKHGGRHTSEYRIWLGIKQRCLNPKNPSYRHYGERGIGVCARWRESFEAFYADMGPRPSAVHTIDRRDNDGGYEPGNCYWATGIEQMNNTRRNVFVSIDGERMTLPEANRRGKLSVPVNTIQNRVCRGWTMEQALAAPLGTNVAARKKQKYNKKTLLVEYRGQVISLKDAVRLSGNDYGRVHHRIKAGWDIATAIDTPGLDRYNTKRSAS